MKTNVILALLASALWLGGCTGSTTRIGSPDADASSTPDGASDAVLPDVAVDPGPPPVRYVLHEWGVFVFDGAGWSVHGPTPDVEVISVDKPVVYLYSDETFTLDLTVGFASGGSTETWPLLPDGAFVDWDGLQVRPGPCETTPFPTVYDEPWVEEPCEACTLGSCVVPGASCLTHGGTVATLLFYAGTMPDYSAPLQASVWTEGVDGMIGFELSNVSGARVHDVWFLYRTTTSTCEYMPEEYCPVATADLAFAYFDEVSAGSGFATSLELVHLEAELDTSGMPIPGTLGSWDEWDSLPEELRDALVERGLYGEEADAFMAAWDTALFGLLGWDSFSIEPMYRNGGALLYFMSDDDYEAQLPLEASPEPSEVVRLGMIYQHL
ncbi:MAG: hypothetical protein JRG91_12690 [Deltaproteobacteria bacterium]|nr:hypothetical protein [Deltaproteobacteria bacterium]